MNGSLAMKRALLVAIPFPALCAAFATVSLYSTPSDTVAAPTSTPAIAWNSPSVSAAIKPGESKHIAAVLTAQRAIPAGSLRVVPELQPFLSVTPSTTPALAKGQILQVTLTFSAKTDAFPGTTTGTVQLRNSASGEAIAVPLGVSVFITWPKYSDPATGVSFSYPAYGLPVTIAAKNFHNSVIYDITVMTSVNNQPQYSIIVRPNTQYQSISQWFAATADEGDLLLKNTFQLQQLPNGMQALVRTGPMPFDAGYDAGPIGPIFAMSSSTKSVVSAEGSNGESLARELGIDESEVETALLAAIGSMQVP